MTEQEWLEQLKPGDVVIVHREGAGRIRTVQVVGKVHITVDGEKYLRRTLRRVNDSRWSRTTLRQPTPGRIALIEEIAERRQLLGRVNAIDGSGVSTGTLRAIVALLDKDAEERKSHD